MTPSDSEMPRDLASPFDTPARHAWAARLRQEVDGNVLPWWQREIFDADGRVLGGRANDGTLLELPRSAVLGTRLLWTFSSAQLRLGPEPERAQAAQQAWDWVRGPLTDAAGHPVADHKQTYAQAFAIYALTACHAWQCVERRQSSQTMTPALQHALQLFALVEKHAFDAAEGGYFEGCMTERLARTGPGR